MVRCKGRSKEGSDLGGGDVASSVEGGRSALPVGAWQVG